MPQQPGEPDIFVLLAKRRRRLTVRILHESATPVSMTELTERIGEREYEDPSTEALHSIRLTLHHSHLPRLEDADVVAYDPSEDTARPGLNFDVLVRALEGVNEQELPWSDQ